jgi:hypothetical protein
VGAVVDRTGADVVLANGDAVALLEDDIGLPTAVEVVVLDDELPQPASTPTMQASAPLPALRSKRRCRPEQVMTTPPTDCPSLTAQGQVLNTRRTRSAREQYRSVRQDCRVLYH